MNAYWEDNPPVHLMVKAYLGIKSKSKEEPGKLEDLIMLLPEGPRIEH